MTTRVVIQNEGPGVVKVVRQMLHDGVWIDGSFDVTELAPGQKIEKYFYREQRYFVEEIVPKGEQGRT